jgi:UDP-N-acetylmuramyl pentapeptide synthase
MNLNDIVSDVIIEKACSIRADKDSNESKTVRLKVRFEGVPLAAVFEKAVSSAVISWQNGPGRRNFDALDNGQVIEIDFKAPGKVQVDPVTAVINAAKAVGMTIEEYLKTEIAKRSGPEDKKDKKNK